MKRKAMKRNFAISFLAVILLLVCSVTAFAEEDGYTIYTGDPDAEPYEFAGEPDEEPNEIVGEPDAEPYETPYFEFEWSEDEEELLGNADPEEAFGFLWSLFGADTLDSESADEPLTPEGNLTLVDDLVDPVTGKQFLTVETRNGNVFYIVVDRSGDKDKVFFLNAVDEADLTALIGEPPEEETPKKCVCGEKCYAGHVNVDCPVCAVNLGDCTGKEAETEVVSPSPAPVTQKDKPNKDKPEEKEEKPTVNPAAAAGLFVVAGVGGVLFFFVRKKGKTGKNRPDNDPDEGDYAEFEKYEEGEDTK